MGRVLNGLRWPVVAAIVLAGCDQMPSGNPMEPLVNLIFPRPDVLGCINRDSPWVWDSLTKQCVALSSSQLNELHAQQKMARESAAEADTERHRRDPRLKEVEECAARLSRYMRQTYSGELFGICMGIPPRPLGQF